MVILGAKGFAKEILTLLQWKNKIDDIFFFDDINHDIPDLLYERFRVIKSWEKLQKHFATICPDFILGVGSPKSRLFFSEKASNQGGNLCSVISNHALIGSFNVEISKGVCILPYATITIDVKIGEGTLINKASSISHGASIGEYSSISPGARILGNVKIGNKTEVGTNAVVLPNVTIGNNCRVGAGAVVTKDVQDGTTVIGIPAKEHNPN